MSRQSKPVMFGLLAVVLSAVAVLFTASMAGQSEARSGDWAMVRVDSQYGYAYLYNRTTGQVCEVSGDTKTLVVEYSEKE